MKTRVNVIFIYFSEAWWSRRRRRSKLRNSEWDQEVRDQINTELKAELDTDLKPKFENDPNAEAGTEYRNDPEVEQLGTEFENDPEIEPGTEFKNDPETKFKDQVHDYKEVGWTPGNFTIQYRINPCS